MTDNFDDLFAAEPVPLTGQAELAHWKVLLVDDEPDIHAVLRLALQDAVVLGRKLMLLDARCGAEAEARLKEHPDIALILLDVVMETENAGLELVGHIRQTLANRRVQIVLVTGQPGYAPQSTVVTDYDINGYRLKSELTSEKIFVSVYTALRTHQVLLELDQHEQQLKLAASVFANSQEGLTITDAENRIVDVNKAFERITGYPREEVIGQNPKILRSGYQSSSFYEEMWQDLKERGSWRGEIWNRRKSGEIYAEILSIDVVRDDHGDIAHYVGAFTDISQIKEHQAELERIANFDALTSLPNRRLLADRLGQELARAQRSARMLAVCYLDLDGFKPVNDQFGHEAGDQLLIEISRRLQNILRAGDTVARLGGDEFVLLFGGLVAIDECTSLLERILETVSLPFDVGTQSVSVTASVGVTLYPRDDADADTLLRHADQAMYQAKASGKSCFHFFDVEFAGQIRFKTDTLQRLDYALAHEEFELYYQPKVNMITGQVIGAEALIRWNHPERGLLPPAEFLPLITGTAFEPALGEWVIEHALRQSEIWTNSGISLQISVNISANHLLNAVFLPGLRAALARHPSVAPNLLELEIIESAAIDDLTHAAHTLATCIAMGLQFALDDFGTGYSSLTYFRKLPVGTLKIDQGFVRDMLEEPEDLGIIENIIGLAHAFNRTVIAEGVETLEHGAMLVIMGCKFGQGYGIARPMPASQIAPWSKQWQDEKNWLTLDKYDLPAQDLGLIVAQRSHDSWYSTLIDHLDHFDHFDHPENAAHPSLPTPQCPLGRWYHSTGLSRYGHLMEYIEIGRLHNNIHALAGNILSLQKSGRESEISVHQAELVTIQNELINAFALLIEQVKASHV